MFAIMMAPARPGRPQMGATLTETHFDPMLHVREVVESLVRRVLAAQPDRINLLMDQIVNSKHCVGRLDQRWGELSEITQNKIACDIGYKAWVLVETDLEGDWGPLSFE
jgi:hypothetical protein